MRCYTIIMILFFLGYGNTTTRKEIPSMVRLYSCSWTMPWMAQGITGDNGSRMAHWQFFNFFMKEFLTSNRPAESSNDVSLHHIPPGPAFTILVQTYLGVLLRFRVYSIATKSTVQRLFFVGSGFPLSSQANCTVLPCK